MGAAERAQDRAPYGAARRDRRDLREPPQRHRGRGRAVPEVRQRGPAARRLGVPPLERGPARMPHGRACRGRIAACLHPARPYRRSRGRRLHARRHERVPRRDRPARRAEPRGARAEGGTCARDRASRRQLPRLHRPRRGPQDGTRHLGERQDAPHWHLRSGRDAAGRRRLRWNASRANRARSSRSRLRSARRRRRAAGRSAGAPGE
jgi:hypothetical protein